ncbi:hypothetical protein HZ326_31234 [Fusarium oxysporum f. sp. albedinis]|nr:hypothetical protein HZ326_31234 [Fusarium oxysporum f. sp. albedinis]
MTIETRSGAMCEAPHRLTQALLCCDRELASCTTCCSLPFPFVRRLDLRGFPCSTVTTVDNPGSSTGSHHRGLD